MAEVGYLAQMDELEEWRRSVRRELERRSGRQDIEVTGGPWRSYDVRVNEAPDGHPIVDLYSPIRRDTHRMRQALDYAVSLIENWEATRAEHEAEMRIVKPIFERLQAMFPDVEMRYTVGYFDVHKVAVQRDPETGKLRASFDLWPAMKEKDIQRLADYIREHMENLRTRGGIMSGCDYWGEAE